MQHRIARVCRLGLRAVVLLAACTPAFAHVDGWNDAEHPKRADPKAVSDLAVAPMRHTLHALNALLRARPDRHALPRTRLRSSWQIGGQWDEPARPAHFLLRDHRESVWVAGRFDAVAGADRLGPMANEMLARVAAGLHRTDQANAERLIAEIRAQHAQALAAQARLGVNGLQPADVPLGRYPKLAKPAPAFPRDLANPSQAQMLRLALRSGDLFEQPMQRVMEALDVDALEALVRAR